VQRLLAEPESSDGSATPASIGFGAALRGLPPAARRRATALAILTVVAAVAAAAGALPVTAAAIFFAGVGVGLLDPPSVAPFLALLLPIGFARTSVHGVQVDLLHAAVVGTAAGYALRLFRARRRPELRAPDVAFAAFVVGVAISGAGPVSKPVWLHSLVFFGGLALVFHCAVRELVERAARRRFYVALAAAAVFESIYGIVQYVQASHSRFFRLGGAIVYPLPKGTLEHSNALGEFLVPCVLVLLGAALAEEGRRRRLGLAVVLITLLGVATPFSRGAWLALAAGVLVLIVGDRQHRRVLSIGAVALVLIATAVALFDKGPLGRRLSSPFRHDAFSLYGFRATLARRAADVIVRHPLTGAGRFSAQGVYAGRLTVATHPHDLLLGVAVFFGIPAAVAFVALLVLALRGAWRGSCSRYPSLASEGIGLLAALAALLVEGLFDYHFWNATLTVEIALLITLAVALGNTPKSSPRSSE
jgi:hypothetical protein